MPEKINNLLGFLKSSKALNLVVLLVIVAAIPLTVFIAQKQQETRQRASVSTTLCFTQTTDNNCLTDTNKPSLKVGDTIMLDILMKPGTNQVIAATLDINFDPVKIATSDSGFVNSSNAFPSLIEGPTYTTGNILVTMSVGIDSTRVIRTDTKIASITFKALELTDTPGTQVTFTNQTSVTSTINDPETNVLSTILPAVLLITAADVSITTTPIPTPFVCTPCAADIDRSRRVDGTDYQRYLLCSGKKSTDKDAYKRPCLNVDINGSGTVDSSDYSCLRQQFNQICGSSFSPSPTSIVFPTRTNIPTTPFPTKTLY